MELRVERRVTEDELARAIAAVLGVDPERIAITSSPSSGDFAVCAQITAPGTLDWRAVAERLATRLLVDDGEANATTALLVTATDAVRVNLDAGVITGLHEHVDRDDVPDRLVVEKQTFTRGEVLRSVLDAAQPLDGSHAPEIQDAEHELAAVLRTLVHRTPTPDDERVVRRTCAILRGAGVVAMSDILRCADGVLAAPWDPDAPA
jgi:hypothetical protein